MPTLQLANLKNKQKTNKAASHHEVTKQGCLITLDAPYLKTNIEAKNKQNYSIYVGTGTRKNVVNFFSPCSKIYAIRGGLPFFLLFFLTILLESGSLR